MKIRTITITAIAITLLALPALVAAQGSGHGPRKGMRGGGEFNAEMLLCRLGDKLDLSDEQKEQIETLIETSKEQSGDLKDQAKTLRETFREAQQPGQFDEQAIRTHANAVHQIETELMVIRLKSRADIFNLLTPEQQQEFETLKQERNERREKRGNRSRR